MTAIALDTDADFVLPLQQAQDRTRVAIDAVRLRLREQRGDRPLDVLYGLPLWDWISDQTAPDPSVVALEVAGQLRRESRIRVVSVVGTGSESEPVVQARVQVAQPDGSAPETLTLVVPLYATQGAPPFYLYVG